MYRIYLLNKNKLNELIKNKFIDIENINIKDNNINKRISNELFNNNEVNVIFIPKEVYETFNKETKEIINNNKMSEDTNVHEFMSKNIIFIIVNKTEDMNELYGYIERYDDMFDSKHLVGIVLYIKDK